MYSNCSSDYISTYSKLLALELYRVQKRRFFFAEKNVKTKFGALSGRKRKSYNIYDMGVSKKNQTIISII